MHSFFGSRWGEVICRLLLLAVLISVCAVPEARATNLAVSEEAVKSSLVYNFMKYVDWSKVEHPLEGREYRVGVMGSGVLYESMKRLNGRLIKGKPINVVRISRLDDAGSCMALFVSSGASVSMERLRTFASNKGVLTIGDLRRFSEFGGMVGLSTRQDRIVFDVNIGEVRRAGLDMNVQLLKLAQEIIE